MRRSGVANVEEALEGARHIVAEMISETADFAQGSARRRCSMKVVIVSRRWRSTPSMRQAKFKMYYEYREPVKKIPSHRMLAIRRGESGKRSLFPDRDRAWRATPVLIRGQGAQAGGDWTPHLELAMEDAWKRLLNPSIQRKCGWS